MSGPVKKGATYHDVMNLPENVVGDLIEGELFVTPRPRVRHAAVQIQIAQELHGRFRWAEGGPGGWWILPEPELHLGTAILVPDLAGWRIERMPSPDPAALFLTIAPCWVCEILSPGTARFDRVAKLPAYADAGVRHAWLVDPDSRTLEVLRLEGELWVLAAQHADQEQVRAEPFTAAEIDLGRWWLPGS
jgi:Uma2 family endonuclease